MPDRKEVEKRVTIANDNRNQHIRNNCQECKTTSGGCLVFASLRDEWLAAHEAMDPFIAEDDAKLRPIPWLTGSLTCRDFSPETSVVIEFQDDSRAEFRYAFFQQEGTNYAVYTEHCGYYLIQCCVVNSIKQVSR